MKADFGLLKLWSTEGSGFHYRTLVHSCFEPVSMEATMLPGEAVAGRYIFAMLSVMWGKAQSPELCQIIQISTSRDSNSSLVSFLSKPSTTCALSYLSTSKVMPIQTCLLSIQTCVNTWDRYMVSMRSSICWASYGVGNNRVGGSTDSNSSTVSSASQLL